jgi:hypothetical protein
VHSLEFNPPIPQKNKQTKNSQTVEHLPPKCEALSSNPNTAKKKKEKV